jgi:hypothetical protein
VTLGSTTTTLTFTGIPTDYKHLQFRCIATASGGVYDVCLRFNGDTGSNYSIHEMRGGGSSAQAFGYASQTYAVASGNVGQSSTSPNVAICDILDYGNPSKTKTIRSMTGYDYVTGGESEYYSCAWFNTSPISSITVFGGSFSANSTFELYGIK